MDLCSELTIFVVGEMRAVAVVADLGLDDTSAGTEESGVGGRLHGVFGSFVVLARLER
jgi:hypothetical protein